MKRGSWTKRIGGYMKLNAEVSFDPIHSKLVLEPFFMMIRVSLLQWGRIALTFVLMPSLLKPLHFDLG
jgi:hypothetical protein